MKRSVSLLIVALMVPIASSAPGNRSRRGACARTAELALHASVFEARSDYYNGLAKCLNSDEDLVDCKADLRAELDEAYELIHDQLEARLDLCAMLGDAPYAPDIDPADFSPILSNPYVGWQLGRTHVYEVQTSDGLERIEVTLQPGTIDIDGVECAIVRDIVTLEGVLIEDTLDWYAQDSAGNVWYFGEIAQNFEEGMLDNLDGSWRMGKDGAQPGIVFPANPVAGDVYRQEFLVNEAEDVGQVLSTTATADVPAGSFTSCLQTLDFTPLEPDVSEQKFYAPGMGVVLELDLVSGDRVELIEILTN